MPPEMVTQMPSIVWPSSLPQRPTVGGYQERFADAVLRTAMETGTAGEISGDLVYEDILSEPVCEQMTPARFPGAF
ncbi:MAG: hypothetical protein KGS00_14755 [Alphaproteobacteria bacterium]|nr:hypothetical protein [Alphaproteobacteria bacterium]